MIDDSPFIYERKTMADYSTVSYKFFALIRQRDWMFQDMAKDKDGKDHVYCKRLSEETSVLRCKTRAWIRPVYTFHKMIREKEYVAQELQGRPDGTTGVIIGTRTAGRSVARIACFSKKPAEPNLYPLLDSPVDIARIVNKD
ncbi:MAG: hypothetical protein Q9184_003598 [Pyrenodesmia sp. 2 TL-2023]